MSSDETQDKTTADKPTTQQGVSVLADSLKQGIADYLQTESVAPQGGEVKVDAHFLREHAGPLATFLLKRAAAKLLPRDLSFTVPAPKSDEATAKPEGQAPASEGAAPVQVSFDLGDFISRLLNPPSINPPR